MPSAMVLPPGLDISFSAHVTTELQKWNLWLVPQCFLQSVAAMDCWRCHGEVFVYCDGCKGAGEAKSILTCWRAKDRTRSARSARGRASSSESPNAAVATPLASGAATAAPSVKNSRAPKAAPKAAPWARRLGSPVVPFTPFFFGGGGGGFNWVPL